MFDFPIGPIFPQCCLICGFYALEDVEAAQEQHTAETGHATFEYI